MLFPRVKFVTVELNKLDWVMALEPKTDVHAPTPVPGSSPASTAVLAQSVWSVPAEMLKELLVMTTSLCEEQPLCVMVHLKVFAPTVKPLTAELKLVGFNTVPKPLTTVQTPLPMTGMLPDKVVFAAQTDWFVPALEVVGRLLIMVTSSEAVQPFSDKVQRKIFEPGLMLVMVELKAEGVVMVAEPTTEVHKPVPVEGGVPERVAPLAHKVWSAPAVTVKALLRTVTSSKLLQPLLVTVQRKVFMPLVRAETALLYRAGDATEPKPVTTVQAPVPMAGTLADKLAVVPQTF